MIYRLGVVGYSTQKFDEEDAKHLIRKAFNHFEQLYPKAEFVVVSGLTDLGIPSLAYNEANKRGWKTIGIACKKAKDYKLFPVDYELIVGDNWGDESETFLHHLNGLIRIGGGRQSLAETENAKKKGLEVLEYELEVK